MPNTQEISLADAIAMTVRYRENRKNILQAQYQNDDLLALCETFDKAAFTAFLENTDCKYLRIYYGMSEDLKVHAIVVGANDEGADILPVQEDEPTAMILEHSQRCPVVCPPASALNSD